VRVRVAWQSSVQSRALIVQPQICDMLKRNPLGFASTFIIRNVEGNVRGVIRRDTSAFVGQSAEDVKPDSRYPVLWRRL
jgi:hypothetical protein